MGVVEQSPPRSRPLMMIAPPCDSNSLEVDALEAAGKERYIKSLGLLIPSTCGYNRNSSIRTRVFLLPRRGQVEKT